MKRISENESWWILNDKFNAVFIHNLVIILQYRDFINDEKRQYYLAILSLYESIINDLTIYRIFIKFQRYRSYHIYEINDLDA
jgi:hypothetical protein